MRHVHHTPPPLSIPTAHKHPHITSTSRHRFTPSRHKHLNFNNILQQTLIRSKSKPIKIPPLSFLNLNPNDPSPHSSLNPSKTIKNPTKMSSLFFISSLIILWYSSNIAWVTYCALVPVVTGVMIASGGEPSFHLFGFIMCISATAARAFKSVLQGILLSSEGEKLNSMNLLLYMSPVAICC
ncbi:putative sugar phosphate transporter domain-containing protein [Helianthus debilis subsp. tardiflorus]